MEEDNKNIPEKSKYTLYLSWVKRTIVFVFVLLICIVVLLQFSVVQTWLSARVTRYISEATNTTVTAERLKISPFDGVILQNFNIIDSHQDTVLHGGSLNISLRKNLFYLLNNTLNLSYIGVKDVHLNIITEFGEAKSNLQRFIDNLSTSPAKKKKGNPLDFDLKEVELSNINIFIHNKNSGKYQEIKLASGTLDINYIDLLCNEFDINAVLLDRPFYSSHTYEYSCRSTDELAVTQTDAAEKIPSDHPGEPLFINLREFIINKGKFGLSNEMVFPDKNFLQSLDYSNFYFDNINLILKDVSLRNGTDLLARLEVLSAVDNTGFEIKKIKSDTISLSPGSISFLSYSIEMGQTIVKDRLSLTFRDFGSFSSFTDDVILNAEMKDSRIYVDDLIHFVKGLGNIPIVRNISKETIELNGRYFGKVNNLGGRNVDIRLGQKLNLAGSFNTRDLLDAENTVLNIKLDKFSTSMRKLKMIIPSFNPPDNFNKLGSINFTGRFDGYLEDFVAYGKLNSDVGTAELDMRLDITGGSNKANYSGKLDLKNFNLGRWSDNPDLGLVNFNSKVEEGKGLTLNTVRAKLSATVKSLFYKKYQYKDFTVNGNLDKNTFKGILKIEDDNINFLFDGTMEYLNKQIFLNFRSDVKKIDFQALNLSSSPLTITAAMDINLYGTNVNDFLGDINISNVDLVVRDSTYHLDQLSLSSKQTIKATKQILIKSDLGDISVDGEYDVSNIVKGIKKVIHSNFPYLTKSWKSDLENVVTNQKFSFNFNLSNSQNFLSLLGLNDSYFRRLSLKGKLDTYKNELSINTGIPFLKINKDSVNDLQLIISSAGKKGDVLLHIDSTFAVGKHFNPIDIQTKLSGDTIDFVLATEKLLDTLENFDIQGRLNPHPKGFNLTLADNLLVMLGKRWNINPKNNIVMGDGYFNMDNLIFSDGTRSIEINDINNNKGLSLDINNFNLNIVNSLIDFEKMQFAGNSSISVQLKDLFAKEKEISGYINTPAFTINGDGYGAVFIDINKAVNAPVKANIAIGDFLAVKAVYDEKEKKLDSRIKLRSAPMTIIEYLLKSGIKDTKGFIDADITLNGPTRDLLLTGEGIINKGKTTLIYTGTTYYFDKQKLKLTNTAIDLNGARIYDQNGNFATIRGGLVHNMFKDFGVNATLSGNNVVGLNTTKADNPDYYGYGVGQLTAEFTGHFDKVNMKINAITGPGTKLIIPVDNSQSSLDQSFIKFVKKADKLPQLNKKPFTVNGINIEMTMTLTPDAEVSLIFNEAKGDIIRGRGRGNLKIDITRQGDFEIFGNYEIEQGEYLFTVALLPVAKPFVVERGGRITWTGDPVNATLDITANYRTRTPIKPFIEEYLTTATENTQSLAEQRSEVDLRLKLGGSLFKPEIKFDLFFPNLISDLSNLTDSKLRLLRSNELELNSQVLGLIVFNAFLPSNRVSDIFGASALQSAGINTLSEFLSSQLSYYITNLLNSALEEDGLISGIDFELGVRNNNLALGSSAANNIFPDEIEVRLKNKFRFMDERFSLNVGGNYVFQNQGITINQVLPDFALEFLLTEDRKLKVRLYGKYDLDPITITGLREKYGLGVAYRTEFGAMLDFERNVKSTIKEIVR